jgi:hypothetical protein
VARTLRRHLSVLKWHDWLLVTGVWNAAGWVFAQRWPLRFWPSDISFCVALGCVVLWVIYEDWEKKITKAPEGADAE